VRGQLVDRDVVIAEQKAELDRVIAQCHKLTRDKHQADADTSALHVSVDRLVHTYSQSTPPDATIQLDRRAACVVGIDGRFWTISISGFRHLENTEYLIPNSTVELRRVGRCELGISRNV